jgi:hypothetical protein
MTTARQTCMCEREECLAPRAAEEGPGSGDTVAAFEHGRKHLPDRPPRHWFQQDQCQFPLSKARTSDVAALNLSALAVTAVLGYL